MQLSLAETNYNVDWLNCCEISCRKQLALSVSRNLSNTVNELCSKFSGCWLDANCVDACSWLYRTGWGHLRLRVIQTYHTNLHCTPDSSAFNLTLRSFTVLSNTHLPFPRKQLWCITKNNVQPKIILSDRTRSIDTFHFQCDMGKHCLWVRIECSYVYGQVEFFIVFFLPIITHYWLNKSMHR